MPDPDDEKGGSQIVPDKPASDAGPTTGADHEQDREGEQRSAADDDRPDSF